MDCPECGEARKHTSECSLQTGALDVQRKTAIWAVAAEKIAPIIEQHGLVQYQVGPIFGPMSKFTPVDQHVEQIIRVSNWLLGLE